MSDEITAAAVDWVADVKKQLREAQEAGVRVAAPALAYIEELERRAASPEHPPFRELVVGGSMQRYEVFALDFDGRVWTLRKNRWEEV